MRKFETMSQPPGSIPSRNRFGIAILASIAASGGVRDALAQQQWQQPALVHGRVLNKSSGAGIPGATIVLASDGRTVATDSAGRYMFGNLPGGPAHFQIHTPGFAAAQFTVNVKAGDDVERTIELE